MNNLKVLSKRIKKILKHSRGFWRHNTTALPKNYKFTLAREIREEALRAMEWQSFFWQVNLAWLLLRKGS